MILSCIRKFNPKVEHTLKSFVLASSLDHYVILTKTRAEWSEPVLLFLYSSRNIQEWIYSAENTEMFSIN